MSFYFEGDYRKKANISHRGASKTSDKASLIRQAQDERQKREEQRKALESACVIQAAARGYYARKLANGESRQSFDSTITQLGRETDVPELQLSSFGDLIMKLGRIYSPERDRTRLVSICQFALSKRALFEKLANLRGELRSVVSAMCIIQLNSELSGASASDSVDQGGQPTTNSNLHSLFRALEVCFVVDAPAFDLLFDAMCKLLDNANVGFYATLFSLTCDVAQRLNVLQGLLHGTGRQDEQQARYAELCRLPAFSRVDAILRLLARPLRRADGNSSAAYSRFVEQLFDYETVTRSTWNAAIRHVLTPFLCAAVARSADASVTDCGMVELAALQRAIVGSKRRLSPWLACAFLTFGDVTVLDKPAAGDYLIALHKLIASLTTAIDDFDASRRVSSVTNPPLEASVPSGEPSIETEIRAIKQRLNIARSSESDSDDESPAPTSAAVTAAAAGWLDEVRATVYALLNRYELVHALDHTLRRFAYDCTLITPLSAVLHELMFAHALRPLEHRFVYYFAFNSEFLRASWTLVLDALRSTCTSSSPTATVTAAAMPSRGEQVRRCAPVVGTFATLFAHALISMHDEQFVQAVRRNVAAVQTMELDLPDSRSSAMPFLASELIGMCKLLRNVAVGLIELRLPFSNRLSQPASAPNESDVAICTYLFEKTTGLLRQLYDRDVRRSLSSLAAQEPSVSEPSALTRLLTTLENDVCTFLTGATQHDATSAAARPTTDTYDDEPVAEGVERESMHAMQSVYEAYARSSFWISSRIRVNVERMALTFFTETDSTDCGSQAANVTSLSPFRQVGWKQARRRAAHVDSRSPNFNSGPTTQAQLAKYSAQELRHVTLLVELPYTVPFMQRVAIFQRILSLDKMRNRNSDTAAFEMPARDGPLVIDISVRRTELYEDAFHALAPARVPNLKRRMRIQLRNFANLEEAGIDGGGILREFLTELLKQGFDPNRGLFVATSDDRLLYPNAHAETVYAGNCLMHYYFLGRMLGKALYEGVLIELPLAAFFVAKLLSSSALSIDYLESLDAELYRNLLFVKNFEGSVESLALDFTVTQANYGEVRTVELKPGGRSMPVTNTNRNEYVNLVADFRLNREIRAFCHAFAAGLNDVVALAWLRMFDYRELQLLLSGTTEPIDLDDLQAHTLYGGKYHASHPTIVIFWRVLAKFSERQKRLFLKFVTSCSRPPLLGFKDLWPKMCISFAGDSSRLPTASTCMNLLKLPEYLDDTTLHDKLLYAIESGAGFELS